MWNLGNEDPLWPKLTDESTFDPWKETRKNHLIFVHRQRDEEKAQALSGADDVLGVTIRALGGLLAGADWGISWLGRVAGRRARAWWWHLCLVVVLGIMCTGCQSLARGWAAAYGLPDPYTHNCAPESLQAGHCISATQDSTKPAEMKR